LKQLNNKKYYLTVLVVASILVGFYYLALENISRSNYRASIMQFTQEYQDYVRFDEIEGLSNNDGNIVIARNISRDNLSTMYRSLHTQVFANIAQRFEQYQNEFSLYERMSTTNFSQDNQLLISQLISDTSYIIDNFEKNLMFDFESLDNIRHNLDILQLTFTSEFENMNDVSLAITNASKNKGTANELVDDCFDNQENENWSIDLEASLRFCVALGLDNCNNLRQDHFGYTRNNPRLVNRSRNQYFDYVSVNNSFFNTQTIKDRLNVGDDQRMFVEVYTKTVNNRQIYKFNVVVLDQDFEMTCDI